MIKAVLFDLDGTLADTAPDLGYTLNVLRERHGKTPLSMDEIRPYASHGTRGLLGIGFNLKPEDEEFLPLRDEYLTLYDEYFCRDTKLFPDIPKLLAEIERRGLKWGIVTNKPARFTDRLMEHLGLAHRAACMVSGDTCARNKPHPDSLLLASEKLELDPRQCLYVGDAERDIQAANAAGMRGIIALYGYIAETDLPDQWAAYATIDEPEELIKYFN